MEQGWITAFLWILFGGSHMGLTVRPVRERLVRQLGEAGFILAYSIVAILTFAALVHYVALHRFAEPGVPLFLSLPPVRGALIVFSVFGFALFITAVWIYPHLPMAVFRHRVVPVRGAQQISRHPFFSGIAIWAVAHAMLAHSPATFVFFVGAVVLSFIGGLHQDRRLTAEIGEPYRAYVAATSFWPFVALITGRQKLNWREQPWIGYGAGFVVSMALYRVHAHIFDHGGAYVIAFVSAGSLIAILNSRARASRARMGAIER